MNQQNRMIVLIVMAVAILAAAGLFCFLKFRGQAAPPAETTARPMSDENTPDPCVVYDNGYYYMTYTHDMAGATSIPLMRSKTLDFRQAEKKVIFTPPQGTSYSRDLWAPELQKVDGHWMIYFAADDGKNENHRMHALEADSGDPWGSWSYKGKVGDDSDKWAIDGAVLQNGKQKYFVWSGWEGDVNVSQNLYIAPMSDRMTLSGPRVEITRPEAQWETIGTPHVIEGPEPLVRNGKLFVIYSCSGSWTPYYKLGQVSCKASADPLNPASWTKKSTPVFQKSDENHVYGPGHNSFTTSPDGKEDWIVYHARADADGGWKNRSARAQRFGWTREGEPDFGIPLPLATPASR